MSTVPASTAADWYQLTQSNFSLPAPGCCQFSDYNDYLNNVAPANFCLSGRDSVEFSFTASWWNRNWDSLKCGENVRFEFGTGQGTSTGSGPLFMRNLND